MLRSVLKLVNVFALFILIMSMNGCGKNNDNPQPQKEPDPEPEIVVTLGDITVTMDENPNLGDTIATLAATSTGSSSISYSILEESISGSCILDDESGVLVVYEPSDFDYEKNPQLSLKVRAYNENTADTAMVLITLEDVIEFDNAFITMWKTTTPGEQIRIPTRDFSMTYDYSVDWGDGTEISTGENGTASHTYSNPGIYTVKVIGEFPAIFFNDNYDQQILSIEQWGNIQWETMEFAFYGCSNLICNATDAPNLSKVKSMQRMFGGAVNFKGDLSNWQVGNVEDMSWLFHGNVIFNSDLSQWDVSSVKTMNRMFLFAETYNQPLNNWDVSSVIDMEQMLGAAYKFNHSLGDWNIRSVTTMEGMLYDTDLSIENYDATLEGWSNSTDVPSDITLGANFLKYCQKGETARNFLINSKGWNIIGDSRASNTVCQ